MDVSGCSKAQRTVIETLPGPLFVAAGAGSGKTFTLKLRTANALLPNASGFQLDSIQQVLAITFTKAAAAELLSRIKDTLLKEGLKEAAFEADGAWISTIHGFCSRLLRENALEIGLDPEFRMITELEDHQMREAARTRVLELVRAGGIGLDDVAWNWDVFGAGEHDRGLMDDAEAIAGKTSALPNGADAFVRFEAAAPAELLEGLVALARAVQDVVEGWDKIHGSWEAPSVGALPGALEAAEAWLASEQAPLAFADAAFAPTVFKDVLDAFPALTPAFGKNKGGQDVVERYRRAHARAAYETSGALGLAGAEAALRLSEALQTEFAQLKRAAGVVDNDDLLRMTLAALKEHPQVAERYRAQFRLIMVDEFQDTDKVQIEILKLIAQPRLANVCVVGDAQQSIYRFRGADVGSFAEYRDDLAQAFPQLKKEELQPKLKQNFRSHADILAFVDAVFSQESSFGAAYLQLEPKGAVNEEPDAVMDGHARVQLDVIHHPKGNDALKERALRASARAIAEHFAQLRSRAADAGERGRTFALLLGTTKNAQVYIDALRAAGMESMMTSGSILMGSDEALMMSALLRVAVNRQDEQPLLDCLTSQLFAISDDALLALAYWKDETGAVRHGSLARGFWGHAEEAWGLPPDEVRAVQIARETLQQFVRRARRGSVTEAVRGVLVASGYLDRMQERGVSGLASVGNCSKLLDLLQGVERETAGVAQALSGFEAKTALAKESPGVLSVAEADFVQIMTIHGSKGLQFDHVAVADIKTGAEQAKGLLAENEGASAFAVSKKGLSVSDKLKGAADALADEAGRTRLHDARTPGEELHQLERTVKTEGLAEARRLLYVGFTRAVRSLHVAHVTFSAPQPKKGVPYGSDGVMREVHKALGWSTDLEQVESVQEMAFGGSRPAQVKVAILKEGDEALPGEASVQQPEEHPFIVPIRPLAEPLFVTPFAGARADMRSYSSLSQKSSCAEMGPVFAGADEADESRVLMREAGEDATDLGTAFHRLAQRAILERAARGGGSLQMPSAEAVAVQAAKSGLTAAQRERLERALSVWFASDVAHELASADDLRAEVPFMVRIQAPDGQPLYLEGELDALACMGSTAHLVDYKTGGSAEEGVQDLMAKHQLQAACYAAALLHSGFARVEATFVRVEQRTPEGTLQTVRYRFASEDLPALETLILAARA